MNLQYMRIPKGRHVNVPACLLSRILKQCRDQISNTMPEKSDRARRIESPMSILVPHLAVTAVVGRRSPYK